MDVIYRIYLVIMSEYLIGDYDGRLVDPQVGGPGVKSTSLYK